jgi:hypothetical protein
VRVLGGRRACEQHPEGEHEDALCDPDVVIAEPV